MIPVAAWNLQVSASILLSLGDFMGIVLVRVNLIDRHCLDWDTGRVKGLKDIEILVQLALKRSLLELRVCWLSLLEVGAEGDLLLELVK